MKIYLAASYLEKAEMRRLRDWLESLGHSVTARWIDEDPAKIDDGALLEDEPQALIEHAQMDLDDIDLADMVIVSTRQLSTTGGRHVEAGYALAKEKDVVVLGKRESVFHCLVRCYRDENELRSAFSREWAQELTKDTDAVG